jgi:hypothetical protein
MFRPRPTSNSATSPSAYPSKSTANGRAQRASARNMNSGVIPASDPMVPEVSSRHPSIPAIPDSDPFGMNPDSEEPSVSRATSAPAYDEHCPPAIVSNGRGRPRKDKGKGKETEKPSVRVKEEPSVTYSLTPDPPLAVVRISFLSCDQVPHYSMV